MLQLYEVFKKLRIYHLSFKKKMLEFHFVDITKQDYFDKQKQNKKKLTKQKNTEITLF